MTNATIFQLPDAALPLDPGALVEVDLPGAPRTSAKTPLKAVALAAAAAVLGSIGVYGIDSTTTAALTWGYVGGLFNGNTVAAGSVALTDGATNFVVVLRSTGAVSVSTTSTNSLSPLYAKLFKVTTLGSNVTAVVDQRLDTNGLLLSAGAGPIAPSTDGTLSANSDAIVSSQKAVKTYVDARISTPLIVDTDGTLAANSDAVVSSQKAVKTYVDARTFTKSTDSTFAANSDAFVPSQKAVKTYVDQQTVVKSTDSTFAANSDAFVPSQKAVKTYVAAAALGGALDTDPTLAANSDARAASQKATKSYVDARVSGVVGGMVYAGAWNASTNTPALVSAVGTKGNYYTVSAAGATALDGHAVWSVGDKAAFNGLAWEKFDGTDSEVLSVAGRTGAVVLSTGDIAGLGTAAAAALDTDATLSAASDARVPSQKAVKAYVDGHASTSPTTTKGDLIVRGALADSRHAVGANGQVLTADSAQVDGVKWTAVPASRGVLVLSDAATVAVDASANDNFRVTLAGNRTLGNPTGLIDGQVLNFRFVQDATGGRTLAYGTAYKFSGGIAPVLSTAASAKDFMSCEFDLIDGTLFCSLLKAFA